MEILYLWNKLGGGIAQSLQHWCCLSVEQRHPIGHLIVNLVLCFQLCANTKRILDLKKIFIISHTYSNNHVAQLVKWEYNDGANLCNSDGRWNIDYTCLGIVRRKGTPPLESFIIKERKWSHAALVEHFIMDATKPAWARSFLQRHTCWLFSLFLLMVLL